MRIPQMLLCCCPACKGELNVTCAEYKDELLSKEFLTEKYQNLVQKFSLEEIQNLLNKLNWTFQNETELIEIVFGRVVYTGNIQCTKCNEEYPIKNRLPRFVKE
ncbi:Conserved_hypothetical protein [Hexamita inflata]|uniref:Uncharacterized protein n=1 Tax=Hexamita inflata TaxID=28002 RepID=A0AA86NX18_9EUKA|nr:Conserved hypothetical protein [Hexamita inflata]